MAGNLGPLTENKPADDCLPMAPLLDLKGVFQAAKQHG